MINNLAIEVNELTRKFGTFRAVDGLTFNVTKGKIFGFLGPNGAGKSTTIRMLCGLLAPSSGEIKIGGVDIVKQHFLVKQCIGYMSQRFSLYNDLTVIENLRFFGGIYGLSEKKLAKRIPEVLKLVNLDEYKKELSQYLASSVRQRLALASAILHSPKIIFLDEPTSGVDPISRQNFWTLIRELADQNITILVTTHYLEEAEFCDQLILIYQGQIIFQGSPRQLKQAITNYILITKSNELVKSLEIIRNLAIKIEANIFNKSLQITIPEKNKLIKNKIQLALETANIKILFFKKISSTLEDAFIYFVQTKKNIN